MSTNRNDRIEENFNPEKKEYAAGNSQLLIEYRKTLIKAFDLGEDIKEMYGVVPPKVIFKSNVGTVVVGITTN